MKRVYQIVSALLVIAQIAVVNLPSVAGEWRRDSHGWWWQEDNGSYPMNTWMLINDKWYYFYGNGYMASNTTTPDGYKVGVDGAWMPNGFPSVYEDKVGGRWLQNEDGQWRYINGDGVYSQSRWQEIDGSWYYFDQEGWLVTSAWIQGMYYVGSSGAMMRDTITEDGFLVDRNGVYIPGSGNAVNGLYRYSHDQLIYVGLRDHSHGRSFYDGMTVQVSRISDDKLEVTFSGTHYPYTYTYIKHAYDHAYYLQGGFMESITFEDGGFIIWPEDGDAETDSYISIFKKVS